MMRVRSPRLPDSERSTISKVLLPIVATALVVWTLMAAAGLFWVWYNSTGFKEVNADYIKPQKEPYLPAAEESIPITGRENGVPTRNQATALVNPFPLSSVSLEKGEEAYEAHCAPCHGKDGDGKGLMGAVARLSPNPDADAPDIRLYLEGFVGNQPIIDPNYVQNQPEGALFWTITNGGEIIMPGFGDALTVEERWHLVNYIKHGLGAAQEAGDNGQ